MNGKTKSNRLLCSISSGQQTEPVLKVFDMNLQDEELDNVCELRKTTERHSHKPFHNRSKANLKNDYLFCETEPEKCRSRFPQTDLYPMTEGILRKISESSSHAMLPKARQTMPSSRLTTQSSQEEHPFRPTLSKKSKELAKVRSNLNLTVFENLYSSKPKCNHTFDSRERPQKQQRNSRSKKSSGKKSRDQSFRRTEQLYRTDRQLSPGERMADNNLLDFLNRKLLERR